LVLLDCTQAIMVQRGAKTGFFAAVMPAHGEATGAALCCYDVALPLMAILPYVSFPQARLQARTRF
jgi:hypothetical protein